DLMVLAFTAAVAIATGLLFGLAPARQAYRLGLEAGLREGMRGGTSASARRTSSALVAAQFALSLLLLVGAGLLLKSFQRLISVNPGFQTDNILTLSLSLPDKKYGTAEQSVRFFESLVERVRGLPGVEAAGLIAGGLAFSSGSNSDGYVVEGHEPPPGGVSEAVEVRNVSSGYFETLGIPLLRGRDFTDSDRDNSPLVAIVDETLARRYWPEGDAIGKRIRFEWSDDWMTIVGVVGGVRDLSLAEAPAPHLYLSHVQWPVQSMNLPMAMNLAVRTSGDPASAISSVRGKVRELDAGLPVYGVQTMVEAMVETLNRERLTNMLLTAFALLAAGLAAVGIYGVVSVYVSSRTAEFGIRLALGAEPAHLLRSVLRRGLMLAAIGTAIGAAGALALTRVLSGLLFEVSATDPVVFTGVVVFLMGLALGACYAPARRSTRIDPMVALRYE
ncbi:MAG TPA: FtsX-like permease family protein, partial [Blastocatellia bacterium]|nr:FtsX-like permease family protein [Blastocatellia bacterium]